MKEIVLAGGSGMRLHPLTKVISKHLLPVHDKPMIYYPLSILMLSNIRDILIISTPQDLPLFQMLLGNGCRFGINLQYAEQPSPDGLAQAFIIGDEFIGDDNVCLTLGDNVFYGQGLSGYLSPAVKKVTDEQIATVFGYYASGRQGYGVAEFNQNKEVISIEEKPVNPKSNYAVVGLYFNPKDVIKIAKRITPSARGELEITSVIQTYLTQGKLSIHLLSRDFAWQDTGTHEALSEAGQFVQAIEKRQGLNISCLEEIAWHEGWLSRTDLTGQIQGCKGTYYDYLKRIIS